MANVEGPVSTLVLDSAKHVCWRCNGSKFYYSKTIDDFNDVSEDTNVAVWAITITGGSFQAEVLLCKQCGAQVIGNVYFFDVAASDGATWTMTNLDASVADGLAAWYLVYLGTDANDKFQYFTISSNTGIASTVITTSVAPHADSDGVVMITRFLPVGLTAGA